MEQIQEALNNQQEALNNHIVELGQATVLTLGDVGNVREGNKPIGRQ